MLTAAAPLRNSAGTLPSSSANAANRSARATIQGHTDDVVLKIFRKNAKRLGSKPFRKSAHKGRRTERITLRNNLFYDIGPKPGEGSAKAYLMGEAPLDVTLDHNTLIHTNSSVLYAWGTNVHRSSDHGMTWSTIDCGPSMMRK